MVDDDANGGILLSSVYNFTECSDGKQYISVPQIINVLGFVQP